jgi:hypothetical protein
MNPNTITFRYPPHMQKTEKTENIFQRYKHRTWTSIGVIHGVKTCMYNKTRTRSYNELISTHNMEVQANCN